MAKNCKTFLFKTVILLLIFFTAVSLTVTQTYSRYLTESEHDIGFTAKQQPKISFNGDDKDDRTLIRIWEWNDGAQQINGKFNLSLKESFGVDSVDFYIRAFIEKNSVLSDENGEQQVIQSAEVSLTLGAYSYNSVLSEANAESYINASGEKVYEGYIYRFCDNVVNENPQEHVFHLETGQSNELDFVLNVNDTEIITDKIYICIEKVK